MGKVTIELKYGASRAISKKVDGGDAEAIDATDGAIDTAVSELTTLHESNMLFSIADTSSEDRSIEFEVYSPFVVESGLKLNIYLNKDNTKFKPSTGLLSYFENLL